MLVPAKINLYLNITGKRPDGYHKLDSLIVFTDICDEINIAHKAKPSFSISGEFSHLLAVDEANIIMRAYRLMQSECARQDNLAINLVKNIPVGAGLGGGSGNAAAILIMLNELWKAGFTQKKLAAIGLKLGADVPIFINRHAAIVSGIGEKISNIQNLPELYALLIYPNKPLSTKEVFASFVESAENLQNNPPPKEKLSKNGDWLNFLKKQNNDLENAAISLLPEIKDIIQQLSALEGCEFARMSGSGSTCFGIFRDKKMGDKALAAMKSTNPACWAWLAKICGDY